MFCGLNWTGDKQVAFTCEKATSFFGTDWNKISNMQANVSSTEHATSLRFRNSRLLYPIRRHQQLQRYPQACPQMRRPIQNKSSLRSCTNHCANRPWTASSRGSSTRGGWSPLLVHPLHCCHFFFKSCNNVFPALPNVRHIPHMGDVKHFRHVICKLNTCRRHTLRLALHTPPKWPNARRNSP